MVAIEVAESATISSLSKIRSGPHDHLANPTIIAYEQ